MNLLKTTVALTSILALSSCGVAEAIEGAIQDEVDARNTARTAVVNTVGGTETASSAAFVEKSDSEDDDSDDTDGDVVVDVSEFSDFENFEDLGEEYQERITDLYEGIGALRSIAFTDPTTLPTSGGATYDGLMSLENLVGEMTMTADFADDAISGSVTNFIIDDDTAVLGTLDIGSGAIDRTADTDTAYTFAADLTGELSIEEEDGAYDIVGTILGDFTGPDHEYVEGSVIGTANHTINEEDTNDFSGHFGGEQQ